jgi:hypothetical protein
VGQGGVEVARLQLGCDHDEVLGHAFGVLLGEGAQLVVDGPVELLTRDPLGNPRLRKPWASRREPATATVLRPRSLVTT